MLLLDATTGKNFRTTALDLASTHGVALTAAVLDHWVTEEKVVSGYLARTLRPDREVLEASLSAYPSAMRGAAP